MITNNSLSLCGEPQPLQETLESVYFDASAFYDWDRHWEEEE